MPWCDSMANNRQTRTSELSKPDVNQPSLQTPVVTGSPGAVCEATPSAAGCLLQCRTGGSPGICRVHVSFKLYNCPVDENKLVSDYVFNLGYPNQFSDVL